MNIERLHLLATELPTIMGLDDEIRLIKELMMIAPGDVARNEDEFRSIVLKLQGSHNDSGIFEVTEENYPVFEDFCEWLHALQPHLRLDVSSLCDGLNLSPHAIAASMNVGRDAAS